MNAILVELPLDLAAHDVGVIGDDGTDAAQVDRHYPGWPPFRPRPGPLGTTASRAVGALLRVTANAAADDGDGNDGNKECLSRMGVPLNVWCLSSQSKILMFRSRMTFRSSGTGPCWYPVGTTGD